jgi:glycosyltransferase involved in cell wall biosynthesis
MTPSTAGLSVLPPSPKGRRGWPWTIETAPAAAENGRTWPAVSIVTPSFNQAPFLEATIRSVLLQGYPNLEYRIFDGGSTDGSVEIIEKYAPWLTGWVSERDRGQSHAINKGFGLASGEVLAWLNSDDRYLPGALFAAARMALAHPGAAAWIGACRSVDVRGREVFLNVPRGLDLPALADWMGAAWFAQPAAFFGAEATRCAGPLDEELQCSFDVDYFLRLARRGPFMGTAEVWAEETRHPAAKTTANPGRSHAELHVIQIRNGFEAVALAQMTRELQEWAVLRRTTCLDRLKAMLTRRLRGPGSTPP